MKHLGLICLLLLWVGQLGAQEKHLWQSPPLLFTGSSPPGARGEPLCAGVPLFGDGVPSRADQLKLVDNRGRSLAARLRPLARKGGPLSDTDRPISWLEICCAIDADVHFPLRLEAAPATRQKPMVTQKEGLWHIVWNDSLVVLDPDAPALLKSISRGGQEILAAPALEFFFVDDTKKRLPSQPWKVELESSGAHAATLLAGTRVGKLLFQLRLQFVKGSDDCIIDLRLVNQGPWGHMGTPSAHVYFDRLSLSLPRPRKATLVSHGNTTDTALHWALLQQHTTPRRKGRPSESFPFQIWNDGKLAYAGERSDGCFALGGEEEAFAYGFQDFWQNAPKAWSIHEKLVLLDVFPVGGSGPHFTGIHGKPGDAGVDPKSLDFYRFEGARAKSHRVAFSVGATTGPRAAARMGRLLNHAPHITVNPADLEGRALLGYVLQSPASAATPAQQRFERFSRIFIDDQAADSQDALGQIGYPAFVARGGTYGRSVFHGWFNYGDIPWGDGYCSLHYDLPFTMLFNYLRSGDQRYLSLGSAMARHRRDIDQDHDVQSTSSRRGGQFYEKGWFHGNYYHPHASHTWVRGPLLHYLLTGSPWSLEAALLNRDFIRRGRPQTWNGDWGARIPGWIVDNLVVLHEVLGRGEDMQLARAIIEQFQKLEKGQGHVVNRRMRPPSWKPWMHNIMFNAIAFYRLSSGDRSFDPLLDRMAAGFRRHALKRNPGGPWLTLRNIIDGSSGTGPSVQLDWSMAASFALLFRIHQRPRDGRLARELFRDAVHFFQERRGSPLAFRMLEYPNSESKIHGGIQLWGLLALPFDRP